MAETVFPAVPLPTVGENPHGLHQRYLIQKSDGSPVSPHALYFVLRLDWAGSDPHHIESSRRAVRKYAEEIRPHIPQLAADLTAYLDRTDPVKAERDRS